MVATQHDVAERRAAWRHCRTALQNTASIASLMLTTETMACGIVEEEN